MRVLRKFLGDERVRYLVVGGWNTLFSYVLFVVLLAMLGAPLRSLESSAVPPLARVGREYYLAINLLVWFIAVPQSTVTMKYLTFRSPGRLLPQVMKAFVIYLPAQGLGMAMLWVTVRLMGLTPQIGGLVTIAVTTVFSYLGHKFFTFRTPLVVGELPDNRPTDRA